MEGKDNVIITVALELINHSHGGIKLSSQQLGMFTKIQMKV